MFYQFGNFIFRVTPYLAVLIPLIVVTFLFSYVILKHENQLKFDEFYVINGVTEAGYSSNVIVRRLVDQMHRIRKETSSYATLYTETELVSDLDSFDLEVPGAGISIKTALNFIENFMGITPNSVSGEITGIKKWGTLSDLALTIRTNTGVPETYKGDIDELIEQGAEYIIKNIEPLTLGLYYDSLGAYDKMQGLIDFVKKNNTSEQALLITYLIESYLNYGIDNLDASIKFAEYALQEDPEDMFALSNIGYLYLENKEYDKALATYNKMLELEPTAYPAIHANIAEILLDLGRTQEALAYIDNVFELDPSDFASYMYRGEYLRRTSQDMELAEKNFGIAIKLFPEVVENNWFKKHHELLEKDLIAVKSR
jgi:hypothetical protein